MIKIVGVRFRTAGKVYYFGPKNLDLKIFRPMTTTFPVVI